MKYLTRTIKEEHTAAIRKIAAKHGAIETVGGYRFRIALDDSGTREELQARLNYQVNSFIADLPPLAPSSR